MTKPDNSGSIASMEDIGNLVAGAIIHEIKNPKTGEDLGVRVSLLPMTDPEIKKIGRRIQDRRNYLSARGKNLTAEEMEEYQLEIVTTATTGWEWYNRVWNGVSNPPFSKKSLRDVCAQYPWFLTDIDEKLGDTKAFFV